MWQKVRAVLGAQGWKSLLTVLALVYGGPLRAQYELGAAVGGYRYSVVARESDQRATASFNNIPSPGLTFAVFYRERCAPRTNLGIELQITRKSFNAQVFDGSRAGSTGIEARVDLYLMHLDITPEIRLNGAGNAVFRFGPQFGFLVGGTMTGGSWMSYPFNSSTSSFVGATPTNFKGDLRFLFGVGFRSSALQAVGLTVDPYFSLALGSILRDDPGATGSEVGIKIGCSLRKERTTMTQWVDRKMPVPATNR